MDDVVVDDVNVEVAAVVGPASATPVDIDSALSAGAAADSCWALSGQALDVVLDVEDDVEDTAVAVVLVVVLGGGTALAAAAVIVVVVDDDVDSMPVPVPLVLGTGAEKPRTPDAPTVMVPPEIHGCATCGSTLCRMFRQISS